MMISGWHGETAETEKVPDRTVEISWDPRLLAGAAVGAFVTPWAVTMPSPEHTAVPGCDIQDVLA